MGNLGWVIALAVLIPKMATARTSDTYTTRRGFIFTAVASDGFGRAWKTPDGAIWSSCIGRFGNQGTQAFGEVVVNSPATAACEKIGGRLPLLADFKSLNSYFMDEKDFWTAADVQDVRHLFFGCRSDGEMFWTASTLSHSFPVARFVKEMDPYGDVTQASRELSVRCVRP